MRLNDCIGHEGLQYIRGGAQGETGDATVLATLQYHMDSTCQSSYL
jgi:hypothetical protein